MASDAHRHRRPHPRRQTRRRATPPPIRGPEGQHGMDVGRAAGGQPIRLATGTIRPGLRRRPRPSPPGHPAPPPAGRTCPAGPPRRPAGPTSAPRTTVAGPGPGPTTQPAHLDLTTPGPPPTPSHHRPRATTADPRTRHVTPGPSACPSTEMPHTPSIVDDRRPMTPPLPADPGQSLLTLQKLTRIYRALSWGGSHCMSSLALPAGGVGGAGGVQPLVDLGLDQLWVGE